MPKPPKRLELRLLPVEHVDVTHLAAVRAGRRSALGKRFNPDEEAYEPTGEPETVVLVGEDIGHDLPHYAAAARHGELRAANEATARALGVPWSPPDAAPEGERDLATEFAASLLRGPRHEVLAAIHERAARAAAREETTQAGPKAPWTE